MTEEHKDTVDQPPEVDSSKELIADKSKAENTNRVKVRKDALEELSDLILERAVTAHPTLRAVLAGTVEVFVKDRPFRTIFDFVANPPKRLAAGSKESDCVIECDERTLFRVHQGDLNPQLAMVSDKMVIRGKSGLAVYFFNLLGE